MDSVDTQIKITQDELGKTKEVLDTAEAGLKEIQIEAFNNYKLMANGLITETMTHELHSIVNDPNMYNIESDFEVLKEFLYDTNIKLYNDNLLPIKDQSDLLLRKVEDVADLYNFLEKTFIKKNNYDEYACENVGAVVGEIERKLKRELSKNKITIIQKNLKTLWYMPKGVLLHVLYNLFTNSIYWIDIREKRALKEKKYCITNNEIVVEQKTESNIWVYDSGLGVLKKMEYILFDEIKRHLIMSQYKIMLTMLKNKRMDSLKKSFYYAASNMNVAVYLSSMAKDEGITNHEILNEWIDLREKYYTYQDSANEIKRTILLSSLFERMSNNVSSKEIENNDFEAFQRFEQYDYHVNEFMTPPMTGDIFYIKGNYYLLLGQECDLSIRNGRRKNPIAELVPIKLVKNKDMGNFKEKYNYEKLLLGKFLDADGKCCNISIDCTKREVIDNEIIDLCAFNDFGKSEICLNQELKIEAKYLLPIEWQQYYENLKIHLLNLKNKYDLIKEHEEILGFNVVQLVNDMGASHNNRLVSIIDFSIEDNVIKYDVKRICRIRNHVLLINKMFLEYRGRQAFNTINMDIGRNTSYAIEIMGSDERVAGNDVTVILTTSRKENENIKRRDWIINKEDILRTIKNVKPLESEKYEKVFEEMDNSILLESNTGNIKNAIKYTKLSTNDELILKLQLLM